MYQTEKEIKFGSANIITHGREQTLAKASSKSLLFSLGRVSIARDKLRLFTVFVSGIEVGLLIDPVPQPQDRLN
jgi:hypothetical protein